MLWFCHLKERNGVQKHCNQTKNQGLVKVSQGAQI